MKKDIYLEAIMLAYELGFEDGEENERWGESDPEDMHNEGYD